MNIQTSTATVYHGGGRRYLTKKAAMRAEAWRILKEHCCDCEEGEPDSFNGRGYPGNICGLHKLDEHRKNEAIQASLPLIEDYQGTGPCACDDSVGYSCRKHDEQRFCEELNDKVSSLLSEQQKESKQTSEQILTDILSL